MINVRSLVELNLLKGERKVSTAQYRRELKEIFSEKEVKETFISPKIKKLNRFELMDI